MDAMKKNENTVDEYIEKFPKDIQNILAEIRQTIRKAAPQAEETISYRMPALKLNGRILLYFAAFKKHVGLYPPAPKAFRKELAPYLGPKGNLQFPLDEQMPLDLIGRIVKYRAAEILKSGKKAK